jgi:hypothetical protein
MTSIETNDIHLDTKYYMSSSALFYLSTDIPRMSSESDYDINVTSVNTYIPSTVMVVSAATDTSPLTPSNLSIMLYRGISASGKQSQGIRDGTSPAAAAGFPSVMKISENNAINNELNSKHVSEEFVNKQINQLNVKKATGHNGISPKILKMAQQEITNPITKLVNKSKNLVRY